MWYKGFLGTFLDKPSLDIIGFVVPANPDIKSSKSPWVNSLVGFPNIFLPDSKRTLLFLLLSDSMILSIALLPTCLAVGKSDD